MITPEYLNECLMYMPKTGNVYWRRRPACHFRTQRRSDVWNNAHAGLLAGWVEKGKYRYLCIDGRKFNFAKTVKQLQGYAESSHQSVPRGYFVTGRGLAVYRSWNYGPQR